MPLSDDKPEHIIGTSFFEPDNVTPVIDNDMCGATLRSVRGVEMLEGAIDRDMIEEVVTGEGHFPGTAQTPDLMTKEYVYPDPGGRQSVNDWLESGALTVWDRALARVADIEACPHRITCLPRQKPKSGPVSPLC